MANKIMAEDNSGGLLAEDGGIMVSGKDWSAHDALITTLLADMETYQNTYIGSNPYYFQGLKTHSSVPVENLTADQLNQAPSSKPTTWTQTGIISQDYPFAVEVHEYLAPGNNKGWQAIFTS